MRFSDIPGHEDLKATLVNSFKKNHIAHAQLFSGNEGSAAMALAMAYISFLFCENKADDDACGQCAGCQKVAKLIHPDVHFFFPGPGKGSDNKEKVEKINQQQQKLWREFLTKRHPYQSLEDWSLLVDAQNKNIQISKEDARNIIRTVSMKSFEGSYKIILIWYPELMHPSAANAILKVLEEPPKDTLYFLVSYNYESLLTTILSRSQLIQVPGFTDEAVVKYLTSHTSVSEPQAQAIAGLAAGNLRKALNDIDSGENLDHQAFADWMRACLYNKFEELIKMAADFKARNKSQQKIFLQYGLSMIRQSILSKAEISLMNISGESQQFAIRFGKALTVDVLDSASNELGKMIQYIDRNANAQLTFLATSIRLSKKIQMPQNAT